MEAGDVRLALDGACDFRAFNKGTVGILEVTDDEHPEILFSTPDA